ncbi:unnamed protein product, partial [Phaeothamnion confervicola]
STSRRRNARRPTRLLRVPHVYRFQAAFSRSVFLLWFVRFLVLLLSLPCRVIEVLDFWQSTLNLHLSFHGVVFCAPLMPVFCLEAMSRFGALFKRSTCNATFNAHTQRAQIPAEHSLKKRPG